MSIMSDQIQFKSSLNQGLTDKLKVRTQWRGGKEWAGWGEIPACYTVFAKLERGFQNIA